MGKYITDQERNSLPEGYVILGYGGEFDQDETEFAGMYWSRLRRWLPATCIGHPSLLYAVKKDSSMAILNGFGSKEEKPLLPEDSAERKRIPLYRASFGQFPLSMIEMAKAVNEGWEKHNGGEAGWNRELSADHEDCLLRHYMEKDWGRFLVRAHMIAELGLEARQGASR